MSDDKKKALSPLQYEVTQCDGTEPPFRNEFWNHKEPGIYVDIVSGEPLFSSTDKFDSGSGWPSFTKPIAEGRVAERSDTRHGMTRTEVRSTTADSHLGHVFPDGPAPTGRRFCINSAALRFIPAAELSRRGYEAFAYLFPDISQVPKENAPAMASQPDRARAILAGGCFWGMEELIRALPGVVDTTVGYTGGSIPDPTYEVVSTDRSGHAEAIEILYDPTKITFEQILRFFFRIHDPTTKNRQGNDIGTRYRSAIFYQSQTEKEIAERVMADITATQQWSKPLTTTLEAASPFYPAEGYHQDYLQKHPGGYTCHYLREPRP